MSETLDKEFRYLVLLSALSGRAISKGDYGIKLGNSQIEKHASDTGLLAVERRPKGTGKLYRSNAKTLEWVSENLHAELPGKNKATQAIFELLRAKTAAYLKTMGVTLTEFLHPEPAAAPLDEDAIGIIRRAYLDLSGGRFNERILLKDLRPRLGTMSRQAQDAALVALIQSGLADLNPEDDPMSRDEADDEAALILGDRRRHLIYLHPEARA
jgi:hypothetical protein